MNSMTNSLSRPTTVMKIFFASVLLLALAVGCTSAPSMSPEKFVLDFIKKHIPMIDLSVAEFYVKEEQAGVIERVQRYIASNKEKGISESVNATTYDFSKINIEVLDQKEEYINDEAVNFLKVAATGNYTKTTKGKTESIIEDELIIIESVAGKWKVTEKINPWK